MTHLRSCVIAAALCAASLARADRAQQPQVTDANIVGVNVQEGQAMPVTGTVTVDNAQPIPVAVASVPRWFQTLLVTATQVTMTTARAGVIDYVAAMCMAPDDLDIKSFTMSSEGPFGSTSAGVQFVSDPFLRFTLAPMSDALDAIYVLAPTAVKLPFVQGTGRVVLSLLGGAENQCYVMLGGYYTE